MTTFDLTGLQGAGPGVGNRDKHRSSVVIDTIIDFSSTSQPNSGVWNFTPNATTLSGNASGDVVKVFTIPAVAGTAATVPYPGGTAVSATFGSTYIVGFAGFEVITADSAGNTGTLSVGDSGSGTRWVNATTVQTTGFKTVSTNTAVFYTSANYIALTVGTGAINAIVRVVASITDISAVDTIIWN